jgi:hypothetical protein
MRAFPRPLIASSPPCSLLTYADAAEDLRRNRDAFAKNVKTAMRGGAVRGESFDRVT